MALPGMEPNRDAASAMEEYLEMQDAKKLPTSMQMSKANTVRFRMAGKKSTLLRLRHS